MVGLNPQTLFEPPLNSTQLARTWRKGTPDGPETLTTFWAVLEAKITWTRQVFEKRAPNTSENPRVRVKLRIYKGMTLQLIQCWIHAVITWDIYLLLQHS